jgi:hypothetical protein
MSKRHRDLLMLSCAILLAGAGPSFGWGDEGHEIVATVAAKILKMDGATATLQKVNALLAMDHTGLVPDTGMRSKPRPPTGLRDR